MQCANPGEIPLAANSDAYPDGICPESKAKMAPRANTLSAKQRLALQLAALRQARNDRDIV